jgi:hypothetical protein
MSPKRSKPDAWSSATDPNLRLYHRRGLKTMMIHKWDICSTIHTLSKAPSGPASAPLESSSRVEQRSPHAGTASPGLLPNVTLTPTTNNEKVENVIVFYRCRQDSSRFSSNSSMLVSGVGKDARGSGPLPTKYLINCRKTTAGHSPYASEATAKLLCSLASARTVNELICGAFFALCPPVE